MSSFGRSHRTWIELCKRLRRELPPVCHLCGGQIDLTLPHNDSRAWTLDHIESLMSNYERAHDVSNLAPAHRGCNSSKGAREGARMNVRRSRAW